MLNKTEPNKTRSKPDVAVDDEDAGDGHDDNENCSAKAQSQPNHDDEPNAVVASETIPTYTRYD